MNPGSKLFPRRRFGGSVIFSFGNCFCNYHVTGQTIENHSYPVAGGEKGKSLAHLGVQLQKVIVATIDDPPLIGAVDDDLVDLRNGLTKTLHLGKERTVNRLGDCVLLSMRVSLATMEASASAEDGDAIRKKRAFSPGSLCSIQNKNGL